VKGVALSRLWILFPPILGASFGVLFLGADWLPVDLKRSGMGMRKGSGWATPIHVDVGNRGRFRTLLYTSPPTTSSVPRASQCSDNVHCQALVLDMFEPLWDLGMECRCVWCLKNLYIGRLCPALSHHFGAVAQSVYCVWRGEIFMAFCARRRMRLGP
jgi:hypothetical protein